MPCKLRTCQPDVTNNLNGNSRRTRSDDEVIVGHSVEEDPEQHRQATSVWLHVTDFLLLPQLKEHLTTSLVKWRSQDRFENENPPRRHKPHFVILMKLQTIWRKSVILLRRDRNMAEQISGICFDLKTIERSIIWPFAFHTMRGISCLAENRLATQGGLFYLEWVSK